MAYIGNTPALSYTSFAKQDFTTSATTSYTLDNPVTNENELALFINFVRQEPTTAYTASGTSLTLTSATSASDDMYCVFLGKAVQTVNPPNSSVGSSQVSADLITGQTALGATPADTDELLISDAGTLKRVDFSYLKTGITQADLWRLNTTFSIPSTNTNTDLTANWERADDATQSGYIGSGMSQSSGIFTFPETGIYQIRFNAFFSAASAHYVSVRIFGTPDNSAYDQLATAEQGLADVGGTDYTNLNVGCHFDCTNTSTHKVKFTVYTTASSTSVYAESTSNATYVTFLRLGDT